MRAVVQRSLKASVSWEETDGRRSCSISAGLVAFLAVGPDDDGEVAKRLADKVGEMRVFAGGDGRPSHSLWELGLEALVIPQFTLYGDLRRGRRPSFVGAAPPDRAQRLFEAFCTRLERSATVAKGSFGAHMEVSVVNDGPFTLYLDSDELFGG